MQSLVSVFYFFGSPGRAIEASRPCGAPREGGGLWGFLSHGLAPVAREQPCLRHGVAGVSVRILLACVAIAGAPPATVRIAINLLGFRHGPVATGEPPQLLLVCWGRQVAACHIMHFVSPVVHLCVDTVVRHDQTPFQGKLLRRSALVALDVHGLRARLLARSFVRRRGRRTAPMRLDPHRLLAGHNATSSQTRRVLVAVSYQSNVTYSVIWDTSQAKNGGITQCPLRQ